MIYVVLYLCLLYPVPEIHVNVTDAITGKPIPDATIIADNCRASLLVATTTIKGRCITTDSDGVGILSPTISLSLMTPWLFSVYKEIYGEVGHPLYCDEGLIIEKERFSWTKPLEVNVKLFPISGLITQDSCDKSALADGVREMTPLKRYDMFNNISDMFFSSCYGRRREANMPKMDYVKIADELSRLFAELKKAYPESSLSDDLNIFNYNGITERAYVHHLISDTEKNIEEVRKGGGSLIPR